MYQNLNKYDGSLYGQASYSGAEFDFEVPDTHVVASPGGLSTTHHHYSKGIYGHGRSATDKFAGQGERYEYGVNGDMYQVGHGAAQRNGHYAEPVPDPEYWKNQDPPIQDSFEMIEPADVIERFTSVEEVQKKSGVVRPWVLFFVFIIGYIMVDFWTGSLFKYLEQNVHGGRQITYQQMAMYSGILSVLFLVVVYAVKIPVKEFECI